MHELSIDIETFSSEDLLAVGVYRYCEAPDFEILLISYAIDDGEIVTFDLTEGAPAPIDTEQEYEFIRMLKDPEYLKTAYNAAFERTCLRTWYHIDLQPEQWACTAVHAATLGLPRSLKGVTEALGLPEDEKKDGVGKALIAYFCKPCKPTARNNMRTRNLPKHDPDKWQLFRDYNAQDVVAESAVKARLRPYPVPDSEQKLWCVDQRINDRGVLTDPVLVQQAITAADRQREQLTAEAERITKLANPNSVSQLKRWLADTDGAEVDSLNKKTLPKLLAGTDNAAVKRVLEIRGELAKSSIKKYEAIRRAANKDNRLRGTLLFYGARTGRWTGRIFQPQNLAQTKMKGLADARDLVRMGEIDGVDMLFGSVANVLSQLIRTALIPKPGAAFAVADFSAIEARVLSWFAREKWRMDVFNSHGKIYEASASQMFRVPIETIAKGKANYALRQKGKIAELALGYGGGKGALTAMGALDMGLTDSELPGLVKAWRAANPAITRFWREVGDAAIDAVEHNRPVKLGSLIFYRAGQFLFIRLPSGRSLAYLKPMLAENRFGEMGLTYEGVEQGKNRWTRIETYGPRLVENIVQATSRDLLANGMMHLAEAGYDICFHVHDEVICEVAPGSLDDVVAKLTNKPKWATDLPLNADGYECDFYRKE